MALWKKWFGLGRSLGSGQSGSAPQTPTAPPSITLKNVNADGAIPLLDIDALLEEQRPLINDLRESLGLVNGEYEQYIDPLIKAYAGYVHLLPASERHHHRCPGGLLRHGLETAVLSCQMSHGLVMEPGGSVMHRQIQERRWRVGSMVAGLVHDIGKPISDVTVRSPDGNHMWNPFVETLLQWGQHWELDSYYPMWVAGRHRRHEQLNIMALDLVLPRELRGFLSPGDQPRILEAIYQCLLGNFFSSPLSKIINLADQESTRRDLAASRLDASDLSTCIPAERYILEAIIRLMESGTWTVNCPGARVWVLDSGTYINWRCAAAIGGILDQEKIPAIPRQCDEMALILLERGYAQYNTAHSDSGDTQGSKYFTIQPDVPNTPPLQALKLTDGAFIFPRMMPPAIADLLYENPASTADGCTPAPPESGCGSTRIKPPAARGADGSGSDPMNFAADNTSINQSCGVVALNSDHGASWGSQEKTVQGSAMPPSGSEPDAGDAQNPQEPVESPKAEIINQITAKPVEMATNRVTDPQMPPLAAQRPSPNPAASKLSPKDLLPAGGRKKSRSKNGRGLDHNRSAAGLPDRTGAGWDFLHQTLSAIAPSSQARGFASNSRRIILIGGELFGDQLQLYEQLLQEGIAQSRQGEFLKLSLEWSRYIFQVFQDHQVSIIKLPLRVMSNATVSADLAFLTPKAQSDSPHSDPADQTAAVKAKSGQLALDLMPGSGTPDREAAVTLGDLDDGFDPSLSQQILDALEPGDSEEESRVGDDVSSGRAKSSRGGGSKNLSRAFAQVNSCLADLAIKMGGDYFPTLELTGRGRSITLQDYFFFMQDQWKKLEPFAVMGYMGSGKIPMGRKFVYRLGQIVFKEDGHEV